MEDLTARFALHVITAPDAAEQGLAAIAADPARFGLDDPRKALGRLTRLPPRRMRPGGAPCA